METCSNAKYDPSVFDVMTMADARKIVLTPEGGLTTEQRWESEAPHILDLMAPLNLNPSSVVLDYGCGLGRLSKLIIEKYGCMIIGADISASMRALSAAYVGSSNFMTCHPDMLARLGVKFDAAVAIWVLQHCFEPADDIGRIKFLLKEEGKLFVVNNNGRAVPARIGDNHQSSWVEDGKKIPPLLDQHFNTLERGKMDPAIVSEFVSARTFWAIYQ